MFMSDQHKNTSGTTLDASLDISTHFTLQSFIKWVIVLIII